MAVFGCKLSVVTIKKKKKCQTRKREKGNKKVGLMQRVNYFYDYSSVFPVLESRVTSLRFYITSGRLGYEM